MMPLRMRALLLIASALTAPGAAALLPSGDPLIQPGAALASGCAVGFVLDGDAPPAHPDAGAVWFTTAADCVGPVGAPVALALAPRLAVGSVAFVDEAAPPAARVALVEVHAVFHPEVSGALRGAPLAPRQTFTQQREVFPGDPLPMARIAALDATQAPALRRAVVIEEHGYDLVVGGPLLPWDLGGPLVHEWTGFAVGVVTGQGPALAHARTVEGIVADLTAAGFPVELRVA